MSWLVALYLWTWPSLVPAQVHGFGAKLTAQTLKCACQHTLGCNIEKITVGFWGVLLIFFSPTSITATTSRFEVNMCLTERYPSCYRALLNVITNSNSEGNDFSYFLFPAPASPHPLFGTPHALRGNSWNAGDRGRGFLGKKWFILRHFQENIMNKFRVRKAYMALWLFHLVPVEKREEGCYCFILEEGDNSVCIS